MTDFAKLSTADLDALIADATRERATRAEQWPDNPPEAFRYEIVPRWSGNIENGRLVLALRSQSHGWVAFGWDRWNLAELYGYLTRSLLSGAMEGQTAPTVIEVVETGGKPH